MQQEQQKLNYGMLMTLGTGFMVISMAWALFNSYVPIFLREFLDSSFLVGVVIVLDNICGMTLQPLMSSLSDRTWTKHGRRIPFIRMGMPIAALAFIFLPLHGSLLTIILPIILFDFSMSIFRGPTVALMPDLTPSHLRSKANGVINFMGGLGTLIALFGGAALYEVNRFLPFLMCSLFMIGVLFLLQWKIKEHPPTNVAKTLEDEQNLLIVTKENQGVAAEERETHDVEESKEGIIQSLIAVFTSREKSALFLLLAIFSWFLGWNGIEGFFTTYGKYSLGITESAASTLMGFFSLSFLACAIPSGFIATRFGRKKTITAGLFGFLGVVTLLFFLKSLMAIRITLFLGGVCWALININSYPMVVEMSGGKVGAYTGLYYFFSSMAAIAGPLLFGWCMDQLGNRVIFVLAFFCLLLAFLFLSRVRAGESSPVSEQMGRVSA